MRQILIDAIVAEYRKHGQRNQEHVLIESLKRIPSDTNLIAFALDLGIDTDRLLNPDHRHELNQSCAVCEVRS